MTMYDQRQFEPSRVTSQNHNEPYQWLLRQAASVFGGRVTQLRHQCDEDVAHLHLSGSRTISAKH